MCNCYTKYMYTLDLDSLYYLKKCAIRRSEEWTYTKWFTYISNLIFRIKDTPLWPLTCRYYDAYSLIDKYNKKTTRVPVLSHQTSRVKTYHLSAKVMSSLTRVVWWMRTATRVVFYLLWIWKYKIVVNNTFLAPTLTFETTIYIDRLCLEIQNNGRCVRKYHSDVVKHCFN